MFFGFSFERSINIKLGSIVQDIFIVDVQTLIVDNFWDFKSLQKYSVLLL